MSRTEVAKIFPKNDFIIRPQKAQYLVIQGERKSLRIALTDEGLTAFASAWKVLLEIEEVRNVLGRFHLEMEEH